LLPPIKHSMLFESPEGFAQLKKDFAGFKDRGKGHESGDLKRVLSRYEAWGKKFYTHKIQPNDLFKKIEGVLGTVEKRTQIGEADSNPVIEMWKWRYKHTHEKTIDAVHKETAEKKKLEEEEERKRKIEENKRKAMAKRAARLAREGKGNATGSTDVPERAENVPPRAEPEAAPRISNPSTSAQVMAGDENNPMMMYGDSAMKQKMAENKARAMERRRLFNERIQKEKDEAAAAAAPSIQKPAASTSTAAKVEPSHSSLPAESTMDEWLPTQGSTRPWETTEAQRELRERQEREAKTQLELREAQERRDRETLESQQTYINSVPVSPNRGQAEPPTSPKYGDLDMGDIPEGDNDHMLSPKKEEPEAEGSYGYNVETLKVRGEHYGFKVPKPKPDGLTAEERKRAFRESLAKQREEMDNATSLRRETQGKEESASSEAKNGDSLNMDSSSRLETSAPGSPQDHPEPRNSSRGTKEEDVAMNMKQGSPQDTHGGVAEKTEDVEMEDAEGCFDG